MLVVSTCDDADELTYAAAPQQKEYGTLRY